MRDELYRAAGFYRSSYLRISVDTDDSFMAYDETLSEIGAATFLHEYIHFLQDITTTHGMFNIVSEVDFIKLFSDKILQPSITFLKVPFLTNVADGNVHTNLEMRKIWIGGGDQLDFACDYSVGSDTYQLTVGNQLWPIQREYIKWGDQQTGGKIYYFGSFCICEGMAYEIEQIIYPNVIQPLASKMPYSAPRLMADKLYPNFTNNVENLIALCDASLMYNDPGNVFCDILRKMELTGYYPALPEDVYDYVYNETNFNYKSMTRPLELYYYMSHLANTQLSDYFRSNIFGQNNLWIVRTLSAAENIRTQVPSFILDLVRSGDIRTSLVFAAIKRKLGTPIIVNNANEMFFENILNSYSVSIEPQYFWVFSEIKDLITTEWSNLKTRNLCGMKDYCDKSCEYNEIASFTDYRCYAEPWERSNDPNRELCCFGAAWKAWGFQGKTLTNE